MKLKEAIDIVLPLLNRERKSLIVPAQYAIYGDFIPRAKHCKKRMEDIEEAIKVLEDAKKS